MIFGGTLETIVHKVEEFPNLPWHKLDPERCAYDWSFGFGGHGLENWQMTISYPEDEKGDIWHVWVVPQPLASIVKVAKNSEAEETRRKIRIAIGVD